MNKLHDGIKSKHLSDCQLLFFPSAFSLLLDTKLNVDSYVDFMGSEVDQTGFPHSWKN